MTGPSNGGGSTRAGTLNENPSLQITPVKLDGAAIFRIGGVSSRAGILNENPSLQITAVKLDGSNYLPSLRSALLLFKVEVF